MAMDMDEQCRAQAFREYRKLMFEVGRRPNMYCKGGGLGMQFWGFRFEERQGPIGYLELATAWRPNVETTIEAFGIHHCMMESNYPPDGRSAGFVPLLERVEVFRAGRVGRRKECVVPGDSREGLLHPSAQHCGLEGSDRRPVSSLPSR
jgi:hypothetical protein